MDDNRRKLLCFYLFLYNTTKDKETVNPNTKTKIILRDSFMPNKLALCSVRCSI